MECFSYKDGCNIHGLALHISRRLKEEQTLPANKQLGVISNIMSFKTVIPLKSKD